MPTNELKIYQPHLMALPEDLKDQTGVSCHRDIVAMILSISTRSGYEPVAITMDDTGANIWIGDKLEEKIDLLDAPRLRGAVKRGQRFEQWLIEVTTPIEFQEFCLKAFSTVIGDFPETPMSHWFDSEKRQESLREEALMRALEQGHLSEVYFLMPTSVGEAIAKGKEGSVKGPWGEILLTKKPVVLTG